MSRSIVVLVILIVTIQNCCLSQTIVDDPNFSYTDALIDPTGFINNAIKQENKTQLIPVGGNYGVIKLDSMGKRINSYNTGYFQPYGFNSPSGIFESADSKVIVFGNFDGYQGFSSRNIIRLLPNGIVDQSFSSPITATNTMIEALAEYPDGKYICSLRDQSSNTTIIRLNHDGSIDLSFTSPYPVSNLQNIAEFIIKPDGSALIIFENFIQKVGYNGTIDNSFNSAIIGSLSTYGYSDSQLLDDGKILYLSNNKVYRLFSNGVIDNSFPTITIPTSSFYAKRIVRTNDNRFYVFGRRGIGSTTPTPLVRRYYLDGTADNTFNLGSGFNNDTPGTLEVNSLVSFDDGTLSIMGSFDDLNDVVTTNAIALENSGIPIWMHKTGSGLTNYWATVIHVDSNNNIFIGGEFATYNGSIRNDITKLNNQGHTDYSFKPGTGFTGRVNDIVTQPDGKILVCGQFSSYNGTSINRVVRLNPNGTIDNTFNTGSGFSGGPIQITSLGLQSDGKIIVAGDFTYYNSQSCARIIRLMPNGSRDLTFTPSSGPNDQVLDLIVKPNDEILICGEFNSYAGTMRPRIALLNSNGLLNTSFVPVAAYAHTDTRSMAIQNDGKIVVGGDFNSYTDHVDRRLGRLNSDGSVDSSFVANALNYNFPEAIGILPDGKLIIGCGTISILTNNGTMIANNTLTWNTGVNDIYVNPAGNPILVGQFTLSNSKYGISRLKLAPAIHHTDLIQSCQPFTWIDGVTYASNNSSSTFTVTNVNGVDSIVHLDLTIQTSSSTDVQTSCESIEWQDGNTYSESTNLPTMTFTNINGCDSIVHLNFTRFHKDSVTDVYEACNSFTWTNGITYFESTNTPSQTLNNASGCDSISTLNLVINHFEPEIEYNGFGMLNSLNGYTVAWINCADNTPIPDITTNSFQPSNNGSYAVIASNGTCTDTSDCINVNNLALNTDNINKLSVYPNPSNDYIHFKSSGNDAMLLNVKTAHGSTVMSKTIFTDQPVSIAALQSGIYLYEIQIGVSIYYGRFEKITQ